jgi:hypothetical protein
MKNGQAELPMHIIYTVQVYEGARDRETRISARSYHDVLQDFHFCIIYR